MEALHYSDFTNHNYDGQIKENGAGRGNIWRMPRVAGRLLASQRLCCMDVISLVGS